MSRLMTRLLLLTIAAAFCATGSAQPAAEKFAPQIKAYTDAANSEKEVLAQMQGLAQDISDFAKEDIKLMTAYMEEAAARWSSAAAALQKGDEAAATSFAKQAQAMDKNRDIWNQRISWRRGQAQREYLPASEQTFALLVGDRKENEIKELEAFMEAKKQRSEAYGRLADAAKPGADPQQLARMQDEIYSLDVEVQVADLKRIWADQDRMYRLYVATDVKISSPALSAANQNLADWRQKYEETYRQLREREHALELLKRRDNAISEARTTAYRQAKAEHDASAKPK